MKNKIMRWIRKQLEDSRTKGIVLGLSGGIDSAVVAALTKEAIGKKKILALILPIHSQNQDLKDAKLLAKALGIKAITIDLSKIYRNLIKILPKASALARANLKPRLRMITLYYFANKLKFLVCGTGNKSEIMAGYFTKYGDGAADILPLGDLLKSQVRNLARNLNIPEYIIRKTPTAGLWPGQTDEQELGISYQELDDILLRLKKGQKQVQPPYLVARVKSRIKTSEHKRRLPKVCKT
ncbi:MAG: NAD(+) synthetase [Omnitrophica WOR_2 bacterium RBG_13_41_10]|nr:MAG: NAD(+) synthetase [Omnitrophica WOR_2 bacterium RBG_13_41_10]